MHNEPEGVPELKLKEASLDQLDNLSVTEKLENEIGLHKERIVNLENALGMLKKHPETQAVIDVLTKLGVR